MDAYDSKMQYGEFLKKLHDYHQLPGILPSFIKKTIGCAATAGFFLMCACVNWEIISDSSQKKMFITPNTPLVASMGVFFTAIMLLVTIKSIADWMEKSKIDKHFLALGVTGARKLQWLDYIKMVADKHPHILSYAGTNWRHLVSIITRKDNYFIGMTQCSVQPNKFPYNTIIYSKLIQYICSDLFDEKGRVSSEVICDSLQSRRKLSSSMRNIASLLLLSSPVVMVVALVGFFVFFLEKLKYSPGSLFSRCWSNHSLVYLREYDELEESVSNRLILSRKLMSSYISRSGKKESQQIWKYIAFSLSAFLSLPIIIALLSENPLEIEFLFGKNIIYVIAMVSSVLAVVRGMTGSENFVRSPRKSYRNLSKIVEVPCGSTNEEDVLAAVVACTEIKIIGFVKEFLSIFASPFVIWKNRGDLSDLIIFYLVEHTENMTPNLECFKNIVSGDLSKSIKDGGGMYKTTEDCDKMAAGPTELLPLVRSQDSLDLV